MQLLRASNMSGLCFWNSNGNDYDGAASGNKPGGRRVCRRNSRVRLTSRRDACGPRHSPQDQVRVSLYPAKDNRGEFMARTAALTTSEFRRGLLETYTVNDRINQL